MVNTQAKTCHDAQSSMMHVRFKEAWHGHIHKQSYKLSGAHYATPLHIEEKHHIQLYSSPCLCYPTVLNVVTWQEVKHMKTTYLGKFK